MEVLNLLQPDNEIPSCVNTSSTLRPNQGTPTHKQEKKVAKWQCTYLRIWGSSGFWLWAGEPGLGPLPVVSHGRSGTAGVGEGWFRGWDLIQGELQSFVFCVPVEWEDTALNLPPQEMGACVLSPGMAVIHIWKKKPAKMSHITGCHKHLDYFRNA